METDEWNLENAMRYSMQHPVFLQAQSGDTCVYITEEDRNKLFEELGQDSPERKVTYVGSMVSLYYNENSFRYDPQRQRWLQNGQYLVGGSTKFYFWYKSGEYMEALKEDKKAFENKTLARVMYFGCINPIIQEIGFDNGWENSYYLHFQKSDDIKTLPEIKLLPKWFFDKYCIDNI